jgi:hypothetical protein
MLAEHIIKTVKTVMIMIMIMIVIDPVEVIWIEHDRGGWLITNDRICVTRLIPNAR